MGLFSWLTSERGPPMAFFSASAFIGVAAGPGVMGYVAQTLGWRWIQVCSDIDDSAVLLINSSSTSKS